MAAESAIGFDRLPRPGPNSHSPHHRSRGPLDGEWRSQGDSFEVAGRPRGLEPGVYRLRGDAYCRGPARIAAVKLREASSDERSVNLTRQCVAPSKARRCVATEAPLSSTSAKECRTRKLSVFRAVFRFTGRYAFEEFVTAGAALPEPSIASPVPVVAPLVGDELRKPNCGRSIQGGKLSRNGCQSSRARYAVPVPEGFHCYE